MGEAEGGCPSPLQVANSSELDFRGGSISAIQVGDELDPEDQYVTPEIADVLSIRCRERWAGNAGSRQRTILAVEVRSVTVAVRSATRGFDREHERVFEAVVVSRRFMFHCCCM
jgi:hypothetical protein